MSLIEISLHSIKDPRSNSLEKWSIPEDFKRFRKQLLRARKSAQPRIKSKLWITGREALIKAQENWSYHLPQCKNFWVRTLVDNVRCQVWCETFDQLRREKGENEARLEAHTSVDKLHEFFHRKK